MSFIKDFWEDGLIHVSENSQVLPYLILEAKFSFFRTKSLKICIIIKKEREVGNRGAQEHISKELWARILHKNDFLSQSS